MCTPSTAEMYRVVNLDDPDTFPGALVDQPSHQCQEKKGIPKEDVKIAAKVQEDEEERTEKLLPPDLSFAESNNQNELRLAKRTYIYKQGLATLAANMVHSSSGFASGFSAPTMSSIQKELELTDSTVHWFASILVVGQILGCLAGGPISDVVGRRKALMAFLFLSLLGWSTVVMSSHFSPDIAIVLLFAGRFLHGLADSLGVSPAIMFVSEVSQTSLRGLFMNSAAVSATCAIPIAYIIGSCVSWQTTASVGATLPAFGLLILLFFSKHDSPVQMMTHGRQEECWLALKWFRSGASLEDIGHEFKAMEKANCKAVTQVDSESRRQPFLQRWCRLFLQPETLRPFLIVATLLGLIPQTGIFSVTYFAMDLFQGLGFADATVFVAVTASSLRALGSIIAGIVVVYKGRRVVLMFSCAGALICIELAALAMLSKEYMPSSHNLLIASICNNILLITIPSFMFFLGIGMTPIPWILLGEWFVFETRSFVGGLISSLFCISALISLQIASVWEASGSVNGLFMFFGLVCLLFTIVAFKCVPETHGKTFNEAVLQSSLPISASAM